MRAGFMAACPKKEFAAPMRIATLIVAAASSLSLAAPALAQQPIPAPGASFAQPGPAAPRMAPQRPMDGWKPQPGAPRPGGWQPGKPSGPQPGKPGGWQPGKPGDWQPGKPGGWQPGKPGGWQPGNPGGYKPGSRWGEKYKGRWQGGWTAPGGWGAYKRPVRGWTLPSYWISGGFWLSDWQSWGLSSPPYGYNWVRYYDDAVLVDRYGRVWDSVSGVDWDGSAYAYGGDGYYVGQGYYAGGYYIIPPSTTVVVVGGGTTTTTTVTEEVVQSGARYVEKRVVRRAPTKLVRRTPTKQLYR